jgi:hypothetical protein
MANWMFSEPMARASYVPQWEKSTIRIRSDHKWPDKVIFDTTMAMLRLNTQANSETTSRAEMLPASTGDRRALDAFAEVIGPKDPARTRNVE